MSWRPSWSYFLISFVCFALAGVAIVVRSLGPPVVFAFTTLCSVFLVFGALESVPERQRRHGARDRRIEGDSR